jgi:hypothetical protein
MSLRLRHLLQLLLTTMFMVASVVAAAADDFPGSKPDRRILKTQEKVDSLFERGDYERAYFIYRQELAPLGDKYAQYMVGYMHMTGKGVERDYIAGSAWYRLAAERGDKNFAKARDEVWQLFTDEQRSESDQKYAELRLQYSDAMIVTKLVEHDLEALDTRMPPSSSLTLAADAAAANTAERARMAERAKRRIEDRLEYLRGAIASGEPLAAEEISRIQALEKRAEALLD